MLSAVKSMPRVGIEPVSVATDVRRFAKEQTVANCKNTEVQEGTADSYVPTVDHHNALSPSASSPISPAVFPSLLAASLALLHLLSSPGDELPLGEHCQGHN